MSFFVRLAEKSGRQQIRWWECIYRIYSAN